MKPKWIKYEKSQDVIPPDCGNEIKEWWYNSNDPSGDWFNSIEECEKFENN